MAARLPVSRYLAEELGATAIEYAMIAVLVFVVIVTSVTAFGNKTTSIMQNVSNAIGGAIG